MIRVSVHLISAIHSSRSTELARMDIFNDGDQSLDDPRRGTYVATTFRGRSKEALDKSIPSKRAVVANWPRQDLHVWNLVRWVLQAMGYDATRPAVKLAGLHYAEPVLAGYRRARPHELGGGMVWEYTMDPGGAPGWEPMWVFEPRGAEPLVTED